MSKYEELSNLKELLDMGALSKDEFDAKKKELLSKVDNNTHAKTKKKTTIIVGITVLIVLILALCALGGNDILSTPSEASYKENVDGIMIGADYDVVFEKAKNDADAKKRVMGVMYTEDKSEIAWAHKSYRGVTFDYAEFCFSSGKVSSIELRKNANGYDGDAAQIIQEAYNNIETNLKSEYSSFQDTDSGLIFVGERENITVCQRELVPGDEYELNVKIEKK